MLLNSAIPLFMWDWDARTQEWAFLTIVHCTAAKSCRKLYIMNLHSRGRILILWGSQRIRHRRLEVYLGNYGEFIASRECVYVGLWVSVRATRKSLNFTQKTIESSVKRSRSGWEEAIRFQLLDISLDLNSTVTLWEKHDFLKYVYPMLRILSFTLPPGTQCSHIEKQTFNDSTSTSTTWEAHISYSSLIEFVLKDGSGNSLSQLCWPLKHPDWKSEMAIGMVQTTVKEKAVRMTATHS